MNDKTDIIKKIFFLETAGSTNTYLKENEFEDGTVAYTFDQTEGRGRGDRRWVDIKNKNLALSVSLKPSCRINPVWYIAAVSLSAIDLLKKSGIRCPWIKWPNDIYVEDKKISGILAESTWINGVQEKMIIGIGLNINSSREELEVIGRKASSIMIETGIVSDLNYSTGLFIANLEKYLSILYSSNGIRKIRRSWIKNSKFIGLKAEWILNGKKTSGTIKKIFDDGTIGFQSENDLYKIVSGDVEIISAIN
jgi:BirA family biotin operon repressor/biotin-[acetyl-CoA-carboxylase] ligase